MGKLYLILALGFFYSINAISQQAWERITPTPQENWINSIIRIPGSDRLIAVGSNSTIMTSDDEGENWDLTFNPAGMYNNFYCKHVYFINQTTGFITGSSESILKTVDGGDSWQVKYTNDIQPEYLFSEIVFNNDSSGFAIGMEGHLLKTTDQGETWSPVPSGTSFFLRSIEFFDEQHGMIACNGNSVEDGHVLLTNDGGTIWNYQPNPAGIPVNYSINDIHKLTDSIILISAGRDGTMHIFKSTDEGSSWYDKYNLLAYSLNFSSFDSLHSVAGSLAQAYQCKIVRTIDGGETWEIIIPENFTWWSTEGICYYDSLNLMAVGSFGKYYKSYDGGITWIKKDIHEYSQAIQKVQFINDSTGYAIGKYFGSGGAAGSYLVKSLNGGETWIQQNFNGMYPAFHFISADTGYLIDAWSEDNLAYTIDGGVNWTRSTIEFDDNFTDFTIKFLNNDIGVLTADDNIMYTKDAGNNWNNCAPYTDAILSYKDIEWLAPDKTLIVGGFSDEVAVLVKVNVDMTWLNEFIVLGMYGNANDIEFINDSTGFIGCSKNAILKTTDRGSTWLPATLMDIEGFNISSINFITESIGYAVGSGQYTNILKTTDGGNSWFPLATNSTSAINSMHFSDQNTGYVYGSYSLIMHTTTGGVVGNQNIQESGVNFLFQVSPNPVIGMCRLYFNPKAPTPQLLMIYDLTGKLVKKILMHSKHDTSINMNSFMSGIYIFKVIFNDGSTAGYKVLKGL